MDVGDRLVMFTDGILDSMAGGSLEEKEACLLAAAQETEMNRIWQRLGVSEEAAPDDMTCLIVEREN